MPDQHGPDSEQLTLSEDVARLADIGELIISGAARLEDFELTSWELAFVGGYVHGAGC